MIKSRLNFIFVKYLTKRNNRIVKLRRQGKSLKFIAAKFDLTSRHISRILACPAFSRRKGGKCSKI
ncbi:MAG: hypothetical protein AAB019_06990 [Planctomycetota bacterium]